LTKPETVFLLHGLGRTANSLLLLEMRLRDAGFDVVNESYPSTKATLEQLIETEPPRLLALRPNAKQVHFVTHSMGGIVMRAYLSKHTIPNLGRVVMMGTPNKGAELIDAMVKFPVLDRIVSPAGKAIGASAKSIPNSINDGDAEFGVIAGRISLNPLLSSLIEGENDGKVSVESTRFPAMKDHIVLPVSHTFMMNDREVARQAICFLKTGAFDHTKT
jgi:pimeloyl-ACP methyl ester carboxylesterase